MMSKRGRKRRDDAPRDAAGRILTSFKNRERKMSAEDHDRNVRDVAQWVRARLIVDALIRDARLSSPLGRMLLLGVPRAITPQMFAAGDRAAEILQRYDAIVLGVSRHPRAIVPGEAGGASVRPDAPPEAARKATSELMAVEKALGAAPRPGVSSAVKELLRGNDVTPEQAGLAILGLVELVKHFELARVSDNDARRGAKRHRFIGEMNLASEIDLKI